MNYVERVHVTGFWGDNVVDIELRNSENFIIGVNGSGKTTIINLIAATLLADLVTLDRIPFEQITIFFRNINDGRLRPKIEVKKINVGNIPLERILYTIHTKHNEPPFEVYLDDMEGSRRFRSSAHERKIRQTYLFEEPDMKDLHSQLNKLFNSSWLSVQRYNFSGKEGSRSSKALIDQKIGEFSNKLLRYLSELNSEAQDETDKFQKIIFLSLISVDSKRQLYHTLEGLNIQNEKESLNEIYQLFNLDKKDYKGKLDKYFKGFQQAFDKRKEQTITVDDAEYLLGTKRIHSVVEQWSAFVNKRKDIYKFRNTFLKVINGLLQNKRLIIDDSNELVVETNLGKRLSLFHLSSGEKQLLILLGETLLQRSRPHIFIADEPELSLHVEWQERLVDNLKSLNPNCQIIFATHSPDIVSHFSKSVIRIANHIR